MNSQGGGRGMEPVAHKSPDHVSILSGAQGVLRPVLLLNTITPQSRNGLLPKPVKTQLENAAGVTVERSICWRRQQHMNKFQLQEYCSLRKQKLSVLNSLHKKYPPSFFLTCMWLITTYSTKYYLCIRKCNDC